MFEREQPLTHSLAQHYAALRKIKRRKQLLRSDLWREIGGEVDRVCNAVEIAHHRDSRARSIDGLRALAWNVQRGRDFDGILRTLRSQNPDLALLVEVDSGMARSGNRNVARELAEALGMSYAFAPSYVVLEDDFGENPEKRENELALAGTAILSRLPIIAARNLDIPELRDKFSSREKRLGRKRAVAVTVETSDGPLPISTVHLDSNASPRQRARQLDAILSQLDGAALAGGDFNTTTYDLESPLRLAYNILHKLIVNGFARTIAHYMTPEIFYERVVFEVLAKHQFAVDNFNDRARGTMRYDFSDAYALQKTRDNVGSLLTKILVYKLRPWGGVVPAKLDWFAARGLRAKSAASLEVPGVSDHHPIVVELAR